MMTARGAFTGNSLRLADMLVRVSVSPSRTLHATARIRICDNGGWTDTWFARRGKVFNIAVRPLVSVRVDVFPAGTRDARLVLEAHNYGLRYAPGARRADLGAAPAAGGGVP